MILKKTKIPVFTIAVSFLTISLILTGCTMGTHVQKNLNVIKDRLQVKQIESIIYEKEGGDSFSGGAQYDILYSDLSVFNKLKEKLFEDEALDCFESGRGVICEKGPISIVLNIADDESQDVKGWNKPFPYVYLVMHDSSGGR